MEPFNSDSKLYHITLMNFFFIIERQYDPSQQQQPIFIGKHIFKSQLEYLEYSIRNPI